MRTKTNEVHMKLSSKQKSSGTSDRSSKKLQFMRELTETNSSQRRKKKVVHDSLYLKMVK